jgi:DNA-binding response OmpR family regulator
MRRLFEPQGEVIISIVSGSLAAAGLINQTFVNLIILDHDTPYGNGSDLLQWIKEYNITIPVITASGIDQNNVNMMVAGASYKFSKDEVINGAADSVIKQILGI